VKALLHICIIVISNVDADICTFLIASFVWLIALSFKCMFDVLCRLRDTGWIFNRTFSQTHWL